jgi:GNAT superfamily N-acetyltransferase
MIRPLEPRDVETLASGIAKLPLMQRYARSETALAADFRAAYERGEHLFVWDAGAGPEGVLWFFPTGNFAMGGYLRLIAMVPGSTSKGAGARLLEEFERQVGAHSRHAFLLVSDFNADAQRFYEKHGYVKVGSLPRLVRPDVDELIYWKRLR